MATREKIILIILMLFVVVGGYVYFFQNGSQEPASATLDQTANLDEFVTQINQSLAKQDYTDADMFKITRAATQWTHDPFLRSALPITKEPVVEKNTADAGKIAAAELNFKYSGYLMIGKSKLAIINGIEYREGDIMEEGEYILKGISPQQAVLGLKGKEVNLFLPLEETTTLPVGTAE